MFRHEVKLNFKSKLGMHHYFVGGGGGGGEGTFLEHEIFSHLKVVGDF